jgi:hypothetical protein
LSIRTSRSARSFVVEVESFHARLQPTARESDTQLLTGGCLVRRSHHRSVVEVSHDRVATLQHRQGTKCVQSFCFGPTLLPSRTQAPIHGSPRALAELVDSQSLASYRIARITEPAPQVA